MMVERYRVTAYKNNKLLFDKSYTRIENAKARLEELKLKSDDYDKVELFDKAKKLFIEDTPKTINEDAHLMSQEERERFWEDVE